MTDDTTTTTAQHTDRTTALAAHATELHGTDPTRPIDDLDALRAHLTDARFVGLGEVTHGTRECFQFKHRIVRFLVDALGCRAFALEANFSETLAIDDYVVHGDGDPREALDGIYFWTWNVESVLALVEWLRAFNADRPVGDRVRFFGVDAQYTQGAVDALRAFFDTVDPAFLGTVRGNLDEAADDGTPPQQDDAIDTQVAAVDRLAPRIRNRLDAHRTEYAAETSADRVALARRHCRVLEQATERKRHFPDALREADTLTHARVRDEAMAENAEWVREFTGTDILPVWAHDAHIARTGLQYGERVPSLGQHLAARHGDDYWAIGSAFARGGFQAIDTAEDTENELIGHELDDPLDDTIETALDDAVGSPAVLSLRQARADDRLAGWLAERPHFQTGATFDPTSPAAELVTYDYTVAFDALAFLPETTRARPLDE
ncbi:erythromycin esterase family protein [Halobacterium salinarum]|uniref:Homolog to erythromycin esterase n=4 Tax=Halobacterium salinarum TaxID=2242 RepID=Q9HP44_HALSA|nr:erythromycin esterase family protein [Halobacterium salinarum]AAG20026.1 succinoglycan biosynthesis [Halobacterium salinarum NRC-1]MBB6089035.1 erythromycin esterase [Halobacterium salinarum]MDL0119684.1 erythromycin esterase family protein [Halobacterium salinarum]MDL0132244.1 erythromycin esterase family protein [Halobacterium salinarum]MDL0136193.1 erythromycin esterase family protein [Halobacterium salinarum]